LECNRHGHQVKAFSSQRRKGAKKDAKEFFGSSFAPLRLCEGNIQVMLPTHTRKQLLTIFTLLLIAISVRVLTLQFMRAHLNDPAWFQVGSYAKFDRQASDILDGRQRLFWIDDSTRTDLAQYPPAFPALVALIYKVSGERSAY
jgi:hypothetical protein